MSNLVILAVSFFRYRAEKQTDTQTNGGKTLPCDTAVDVGNDRKTNYVLYTVA